MAVSFNTIIGDNESDGFDGHTDLQVSAREERQTQSIIGSVNAKTIGRGNRVYNITFKSRKRHADAAAAATFCGSHAAALAGEAAFSGFGVSLEAATCDVAIRQIGLMTEASYNITGSKAPV